MSLRHFRHHVNGQEITSVAGVTFDTYNPTTGEKWGVFAAGGKEDMAHAVEAAQAALAGPWAGLSPTRRGRLLMRWGDMILEHAGRIADLETAQNGKLLAETSGQAHALQDWL